MKVELLQVKLCQMDSAEGTALGDGLETIWWKTETDEAATALAIEYLRNIQDLAKKAEEILTGVRTEL
jgi:hypothetical protein